MSGLKRFITEIHRRSLWQVLGIYVVGSWIAYEVVLNLVEGLQLPAWLPGGAIVLFIIGLPIVLATAFVQEGAPFQGAVPDASEKPAAKVFNWKNAVLGGVVAFLLLGMTAGGYMMVRQPAEESGASAMSVAALPFENMSADQEDAYFTDGFHDELLTQLSKIGSLRVISRTSVLGYKGTTKNLRVIADELGVRYILEGSVRRFGERVKITAQLIDSRNDHHVWAETYERSRADLFAIQAEVATAIAQAMNVELSPETEASLRALPTTSTEAHDFYLKSLEYQRIGGASTRAQRGEHWRSAVDMLEKAVAADARFALAWAELGVAHARLTWFSYDLSPARMETAKRAIDRALELEPALPQARTALGYYYYWGKRDYERALDAFTVAQNGLPGSSELSNLRAFVLRRMGRFDETIQLLTTSVQKDPLNGLMIRELATSYRAAERYDKAIEWSDRGIAIAPGYPELYAVKTEALLWGRADIAGARASTEAGLRQAPGDPELLLELWRVEMTAGDYAAAQRAAERLTVESVDVQEETLPRPLLIGLALHAAGQAASARPLLAQARDTLEAASARYPNDYRAAVSLSWTYAALGDRARATRAAERASALLPISLDHLHGPHIAVRVAYAYALIGEAGRAVEQLSIAYGAPARSPLLRVDARWNNIRNTPEFRRLVQ